ncbi:uncharacterized protein [Temnothorax nylanderi]|uniref:uncharacterized protein n=1 Tax=Temnothorax nylanderi TaxID=102681 RepID=UPI003A8C6AEA
MESELNTTILRRDSGFGGPKIDREVTKMQKNLNEAQKLLVKKKRNAEYQKTFRAKRHALLNEVIKNPAVKQQLNVHEAVGRPRLEEAQPELLKVLTEIASFGGGADEKRRTEMIRSCRTLDDLDKELQALGFNLSRSATYLRLLPRSSSTIQGKKHVLTVPVKLARATNDEHKSHPDGKFCTASIRAIESLASMLGPAQVFFLSQDDKARIPIGKTAVEKQAPFLMHMEYRVRLPDHDWVVAEKHKLIPSVYAGIKITPEGMGKPEAVTYSGPTYIAIRSGKHSSSSARTHGLDLERLMELKEFQSLAKTDDNRVKPVVIITVDGGPDENPRFPQVISHAISHFQKFDLDAVFIVTNAPGRSCFNRVERRMAPLSHQLSGVVLPYDSFGNHLDDQRRTIDDELELQNFKKAGDILAQIWSTLIIDEEPVVAEYISPESDNIDVNQAKWTPDWYCRHVRESQYLLQISKCTESKCCGDLRSSLRIILQDGFIPPPCPLQQTKTLDIPLPKDSANANFCPLFVQLSLNIEIPSRPDFILTPYDFYCPTVQTQLNKRTCPTCGLYFASNKNVKSHCQLVHKYQCARTEKLQPIKLIRRRAGQSLCLTPYTNNNVYDIEWYEDDEIDVERLEEPEEQNNEPVIPVINSISDWLVSPWINK